jgi:hypothetical protein
MNTGKDSLNAHKALALNHYDQQELHQNRS